jgi:hypothetical protein
MSMHTTPEELLGKWRQTPEPSIPEPDPQTIMERPTDDSLVYLWHSGKETNEWLEYDGKTKDLIR